MSDEIQGILKIIFGGGISDAEIREIVKKGIVNLLASQLWHGIPGIVDRLDRGLNLGHSAQKIGRELREYASTGKELQPEFIKRLEKVYTEWEKVIGGLGNTGDDITNNLLSEIERVKKYAGKLKSGELGMKGMYSKWLDELERSVSKSVVNKDLFVDIAKRRVRYQAVRVSRTETQRAYSESFLKSVEDNKIIEGIKINLSGAHKIKCVCDMVAGKVYQKGSEPKLPLHPQCTCYYTGVYDQDLFKKIGEYLKSNNINKSEAVKWVKNKVGKI